LTRGPGFALHVDGDAGYTHARSFTRVRARTRRDGGGGGETGALARAPGMVRARKPDLSRVYPRARVETATFRRGSSRQSLPPSRARAEFFGFPSSRAGEAHGGTKRAGAKRDIRRKIRAGRATRTVTELAVHYSRDTFQRRRSDKNYTSSIACSELRIIQRYIKEKGKKKKKEKKTPDDARTAGCDTGSVRMNLRARDPMKLSKVIGHRN